MVGGTIWSRMASRQKIASTAPAAPSRWPMEDLVEDIDVLGGRIAEQALDRAQFDTVGHGRGAMGVDVVDVGRRKAGAFQRHLHRAKAAVAVLRRGGDVIGVARQAIAVDFAIDFRAARLGVFVFFEHHDAGAFAHDEAVAVLVVGARGLLRRVVKAGGKRAAGGEAGNAQAADRGFRAARQHHVGIVERDQTRRVADGMRAGGAGRDDRVIGPLVADADRDIAGDQIDQPSGNEERRRAGAGPFSCTRIAASSMPGRPPMPEPISTPVRQRSSSVFGS